MKIALLDHDTASRAAHEHLARQAGFHCTAFGSGRELMRSLHRDAHDLLLIDWDLPGLSGPSLLEGIRNQVGPVTPLLLLARPLADAEIATALRAGADCVLAKPCAPDLLVAQLHAMGRRSANGDGIAVEQYGSFRFELATRTLLVDGSAPHLTPKEYTLALLLFRHLNRAVSRSYILETIWGIDPGLTTRTLDIHISKIRGKLNLKPDHGYRLQPVYGFGYRLEECAA